MQQQKEVWRYGVSCTGIKKRCRKVDFHTSGKNELGESESASHEEAILKANEWLKNNMKEVKKSWATITKWKTDGQVETWEMFNPEHNIKIPLESKQ
jgi:hypothetical protein